MQFHMLSILLWQKYFTFEVNWIFLAQCPPVPLAEARGSPVVLALERLQLNTTTAKKKSRSTTRPERDSHTRARTTDVGQYTS